jgi:hypothetical protein
MSRTSVVLVVGLELEQFFVGGCDALCLCPEIDEHSDLVLDTDDLAEAVCVVGYAVLQDELLEDGYGGGFEGASGQGTARGAR